ncbi:caspase domain-containing protein [Desarmillaria tabescens]|uniref:Caspase domain-containing protein n=1 Tax=Armillaria tabescens TaxID=1929756 RepID=A0AA39JE52_ARMTA|nr:caspase domain-containing protein [Desarmillaria tabescens]KAK0440948.1 caspase domain-containing protein [Desarmillaria tabescens]
MVDQEDFLKEALTRHEKIEEELAAGFGMTLGDVLDTEVVDAAMLWAAQVEEDLQRIRSKIRVLHELRCIRTELAGIDKPPHEVDGRRFWAVIIGIDAYPGDSALEGCMQDALAIENLLKTRLHVPKERIRLLLGPSHDDTSPELSDARVISPTRQQIISALTDLVEKPDIMKDDGIIIYYAGHGSAYAIPDDTYTINGSEVATPNLGFVEALCPLDRCDNSDTEIIPDISGRELNVILRQMSLEKGPDITVIFDCCHSGRITMTPKSTIRFANPLTASPTVLGAMMTAADTLLRRYPDPEKPKEQSVWTPKWTANTASHVLLAACKSYQSASEIVDKSGHHGLFTDALLRALESSQVEAGCSFVELLKTMPSWKNRTPVVTGDRKHSPLWFRESLPHPTEETQRQQPDPDHSSDSSESSSTRPTVPARRFCTTS